ncbi:MAG: hypothetical protein AB1696_25445 [Planctomycetota bacterium]
MVAKNRRFEIVKIRLFLGVMMSTLCTSITAADGPAARYIEAQLRVVRSLDAQIVPLADAADESASRLLAGGSIFLAGEKGIVSELLGRAGGLCAAKPLALDKPLPPLTRNDVVLLSDYGSPGTLDMALEKLSPFGALVIVFASAEHPMLRQTPAANVRAVPVDIPLDSRLVRLASGESLIPTAPPAISAAEWAYVAELLGACRRHHKQLAVYLSIRLDEGRRRFNRTKGLLFEPDLRPEPVARGECARSFLAGADRSLQAVRAEELERIRKAAARLREAISAHRQIARSLMGHLPPTEAGGSGDVRFFTQTTRLEGEQGETWIRENLHEGDVFLFVGYQRNEDAMAAAANALGVRTIFFTSTASGPEQMKNPRHIYINPNWPLTDACLELPGYDVKACPLSGIMGLTCYYAICAETVSQ